MTKKSINTFIISFVLFAGLIHVITSFLYKKQEERQKGEAKLVQETITDRFKLFLRPHFSAAVIASQFFEEDDFSNKDYTSLASEIMDLHKEIIGFNLLKPNGEIFRIFPTEKNIKARGKITQNFSDLIQALKIGHKFWFSGPLQLYQEQFGFVIYSPVYHRDELKGWISLVISTQRFIEKFKLEELLKAYDLSIKDDHSGLTYLSTGVPADKGSRVYETELVLYGRKILIETWNKEFDNPFWSWKLKLATSGLLSLIMVYIIGLYAQRQESKIQLNEISTVLQLTLKEALKNFIDIHSQMGPKENTNYMTNLIEQINLLQTMAHTEDYSGEGMREFLPLLKEQLKSFSEIIEKKNLSVNFKEEALKDISISYSGWLIQHSVISNILFHSIIYAEVGADILISHHQSINNHRIQFHTSRIVNNVNHLDLENDRRILVAKRALQIYQGDLFIETKDHEDMIISIILPRDPQTA